MSYKNRAKIRKFQKKVTWFWNWIKFKWLSLSNSWKIIIFGSIISFTSLFMPWIISKDWKELSVNSFSNLSGKSWMLVIILIMIILFFVFSLKNKERLKLLSNVHIKDYSMYILSWLFIIVISFIVLNFSQWLIVFQDNMIYWKWIIFNLIWGILIFTWWIYTKKEESSNNSTETIFINDDNEIDSDLEDDKKNNMKLPF